MFRSDKLVFFTFFPIVIAVGSIVLVLPVSYGNPQVADLRYIDALFTAASAVCVTGLITVDTAAYTPFGQAVILGLIQIGGLGIISLSTLFLAFPGKRISLKSRKIIKGYYIEHIESDPRRIVRNIILMTLGIEAIGTGLLYAMFRAQGVERPAFNAVFHAISAFCNAGFSLFSDSLERFVDHAGVNVVVIALIVTGGLSFIVLQEIARRAVSRRSHLSLHSRVVLITTGALIVVGVGAFLLFESTMTPLAALFQAVTPRTAGFNTVVQSELSAPSLVVTMALMLVGGAPGSIAGGIKVTTFFLLFLIIFRRPLEDGSIQVWKRSVPHGVITSATEFIVKTLALLFTATLLLTVTETLISVPAVGSAPPTFLQVLFETVSAFGTVGLSLGITPQLSDPGKVVVIGTMFAGRIGLITMAMPTARRVIDSLVRYPDGEVMIG